MEYYGRALKVLQLLCQRFTRARQSRGHSTKDILLGVAPPSDILPQAESLSLEKPPKTSSNWEEFHEAVERRDAIGALKVMVKHFIELPTRSSELYSRLINACSEMHQVQLAKRLFSLAESDLQNRLYPIVYESMIGLYANMYDYPSALALVQEMHQRDVRITIEAYVQLLEAFVKTVDLELSSRLRNETEKAYVRNRQPFLEHIFDEQSRLVDITPALEIYREILHSGMKPTLRIFSLLLLLASRLGNMKFAERVLEEMKVFGTQPDSHVVGLLTHIYASAGQAKQAEELLWESHRRNNTHPDIYALNALISSYTRMGNARDAMRIFKVIQDTCTPSFMTFSMLFGMFIDLDRLSDALTVMEQMRTAGFEPNAHNYNHLLAHYYRKNQYSHFFTLIEHMREAGIDGGSYARAMTFGMLGRHSKLDELCEQWRQLRNSRITLTEYSTLMQYLLELEDEETLRDVVRHLNHAAIFKADTHHATRTFLYAFTRVGDFDAAYECLTQLRGRSDVHLFNIVLQGLAVEGRVDDADRFIQLMESVRCSKSHSSYVLLIYLAGDIGDLQRVGTLWREYLDSGLVLKVEPVKSIMSAYLQNGQPEQALFIFEQVLANVPSLLNESLYAFYIDALFNTGQAGKVWDIMTEMTNAKLPATVRTYNILLDHYSRAADQDNFERVLTLMSASDVQPNKYSYALSIRLKVSLNHFDAAETLISKLEATDTDLASIGRVYLISGLLKCSMALDDEFHDRAQSLSTGIVEPPAALYAAWIYYYGRVGSSRGAIQTLDAMRARKLVPDSKLVEYVNSLEQTRH
jgi:pentatricopeptide repeat protein